MDPGSGYDDPNEERRSWWQAQQSPSDRITRVEKDVEYLRVGADTVRKALDALGDERREAGRELRLLIERMGDRLDGQFKALDVRLEAIEQERDELKRFKRRMLGYAGSLAAVVAGTWQVFQVIGPWLRSFFEAKP